MRHQPQLPDHRGVLEELHHDSLAPFRVRESGYQAKRPVKELQPQRPQWAQVGGHPPVRFTSNNNAYALACDVYKLAMVWSFRMARRGLRGWYILQCRGQQCSGHRSGDARPSRQCGSKRALQSHAQKVPGPAGRRSAYFPTRPGSCFHYAPWRGKFRRSLYMTPW